MPSHIPNVQEPFEGPYATREARAEYARGLRELADWVEMTEFPIPDYYLRAQDHFGYGTLNVSSIFIEDEGFIQRPGSAARLIGGKVEKGTSTYGTEYILRRRFGNNVSFTYAMQREAVCTARDEEVVVEEPKPIDAARDAELAEKIKQLEEERESLPTELRPVTSTKRVYDCPPALLSREKTEA